MGYKERWLGRLWRWAKTLFVLLTMLGSLLLVCAPPLLIAALDVLLPSALLLSAASDRPFEIAAQLRNYRFRSSLVDVPLVSIARSLLILCVYVACSGRGPYLAITAACSVASVGFVSLKAVTVFGSAPPTGGGRRLLSAGGREGAAATEALFLCSLALAVAHIVVAYRTSCRERKKMLVYKIDIEAVSTYSNDFAGYKKISLSK